MRSEPFNTTRGSRAVRFRARLRLACVAALLTPAIGLAEPVDKPQFERDVWPIVANRCVGCHADVKPKGGLDLRSVAAMLRGGDSGPAFVPSEPGQSLLLERVTQDEMPPAGEKRLSAAEIKVLRNWVAAGAPAKDPAAVPPPVSPVTEQDRQFWSFRPLARPPVPDAIDPSGRTPIDAFLLARLRGKGLAFSPPADKLVLVRRAYLDLIGLPPEPEEVERFLADRDEGAYERLLDRLLASPHFGERWGRHWLDVAGYVDTIGFDTDATNIMLSEGKWRYRDYVIRALNEDKQYDRFVTEQLAGDELYDWRRAKHYSPEMLDALVATGYLRTARDLTHEDVGVIRQNFFGIVHDTLEIVGTGLLGLTLNCARCHSHKFDPIPQEDYYRLMATVTPAYNPQTWRPVIAYDPKVVDRTLADVAPAEQAEMERANAELDRQIAGLREQLDAFCRPRREKLLEAKLAALPEAIRADVKQAVETATDKRTEVQKYLAGKFAGNLKITPQDVRAALAPQEQKAASELDAQIAACESRRRKWGKIQALFDVGPLPATHLLIRGSEETPGAEVPPGFLRVLSSVESDAAPAITPPVAETSGRRLALARWLTRRDSPAGALLARVMANRIWQQLLGRGLVPTPDNFGFQGQPPTHPELLEWLSAEFVDGGWRIKPLIKQIMLSATYRQSSHESGSHAAGAADPAVVDPAVVDPDNELLWRMRLRRLESEVVRDSILAASGTLNRALGGPSVMIRSESDGMVVVAQDKLPRPEEACRRSVYLVSRRAYNVSILTIFDQPLVATNCLRRDESAVPLQSLLMLNDKFLAEQAGHFANRVAKRAGDSPEAQIDEAFRLALARQPSASERTTCRELLDAPRALWQSAGKDANEAHRLALSQLCQTLLNASEFLYVE